MVGGGIIERNMAILEGDKLTASVYEVPERRIKKKRDKKLKKKRSKPKKPAGFVAPLMTKTDIAAYDP